MEDKAKFIGYQECPGHAPLALYNVLDKGHRLHGSTVSAHTLAKENIPVPHTPKYYDPDQLAMGIKVEMEHTTDPAIAEKIAKDHMDEIPDYYTRLAKMEREAGVKTNPEGKNKKSYKGETDVKAIGNIPAPRPGMMMVVNPSKLSKKQIAARKMVADQIDKGLQSGVLWLRPHFGDSVITPDGRIGILRGSGGLGSQRVKVMFPNGGHSFENWDDLRPAKKEKKNPALLVLNPKESVKVYDNGKNTLLLQPLGPYTVIIGKSVYTMSKDANSPQGINQYVGELKDLPGAKQGIPVAVKDLPTGVQSAIKDRLGKENPSKLQRWHDRLDRHYKTLERLAAHVGLKNADGKKLSVALLKLENQMRKATTDYANGDIDQSQLDKIEFEVTGKVFKLFGKLPGFFVNMDPRGYALKIDDKFMPRYEKVGLERDWGGYGILSPEISKENPAKMRKLPGQELYRVTGPGGKVHAKGTTKAKAAAQKRIIDQKDNPMVKDMTSYRQKQQIKADVKRMASLPQRRPHPEFATLELAAEYVEKALGRVTSIIQGKSSYVIRHANGIAAFSKEKNNKLIML